MSQSIPAIWTDCLPLSEERLARCNALSWRYRRPGSEGKEEEVPKGFSTGLA